MILTHILARMNTSLRRIAAAGFRLLPPCLIRHGSGSAEHEVVELAGVIIVEGKATSAVRQEIVSGDPVAFVDRVESSANVFQNRVSPASDR